MNRFDTPALREARKTCLGALESFKRAQEAVHKAEAERDRLATTFSDSQLTTAQLERDFAATVTGGDGSEGGRIAGQLALERERARLLDRALETAEATLAGSMVGLFNAELAANRSTLAYFQQVKAGLESLLMAAVQPVLDDAAQVILAAAEPAFRPAVDVRQQILALLKHALEDTTFNLQRGALGVVAGVPADPVVAKELAEVREAVSRVEPGMGYLGALQHPRESLAAITEALHAVRTRQQVADSARHGHVDEAA